MTTALLTAIAIALFSQLGVLLFSHNKQLVGIERYAIPAAVGVFLSLVLYELIPETLAENSEYGGLAIAFGFILFYILSYVLHDYFHKKAHDNCDKRGAAALLLIGNATHKVADGIILGSAFLVDPTVGIAVGIGLALHEAPQEIVEFGVLIRAGYTRLEAVVRNILSASTLVISTFLTVLIFEQAHAFIWIITGVAAGNLLYLGASDLLPRIHGTLRNYGSFWVTVFSIIFGFTIMTSTIYISHEKFGHEHDMHDEHDEDEEASEIE